MSIEISKEMWEANKDRYDALEDAIRIIKEYAPEGCNAACKWCYECTLASEVQAFIDKTKKLLG